MVRFLLCCHNFFCYMILFTVSSNKNKILLGSSSAKTVVAVQQVSHFSPNLCSGILYGFRPWNFGQVFKPILVWFVVFQFRKPSSKYLCHCFRRRAMDTFKYLVLRYAFLQGITGLCMLRCCRLNLIPNTSAVSYITFETEIESLPGTKTVGW